MWQRFTKLYKKIMMMKDQIKDGRDLKRKPNNRYAMRINCEDAKYLILKHTF